MFDPNKSKPVGPKTSRLLGIPLLTDLQKTELLEREDHGITPAEVKRFSTFEEWQNRKSEGNRGLGFFISVPKPGQEDRSLFTPFRELPAFQRLVVIHPDLVANLGHRMDSIDGMVPDEETDRMLWQAHELMAGLTDVDDTFGELEDDPFVRLPNGQINPKYLQQ